MSSLFRIQSQLLNDGCITEAEVATIQQHVQSDGQLDLVDVKFLVSLRSEARQVCRAFDEFFFPVLRDVLLQDGQITPDEQYYLLKMLYSDGRITDTELRLLDDLRQKLSHTSPEFEALCETACAAPSTGWDVGGR
jgi:hypothetical protein